MKIYMGTKNIERKKMGFHNVKDCNGRKRKFMKNEDFAEKERRVRIFSRLALTGIKKIRSFGSRKMNSKAQISATSRDCLVQKVRLFCREREREPFSGPY